MTLDDALDELTEFTNRTGLRVGVGTVGRLLVAHRDESGRLDVWAIDYDKEQKRYVDDSALARLRRDRDR